MRKSLMISASILLVFLLFQTGQAQLSFATSGDAPSPGATMSTWLADEITEAKFFELTSTTGGNQVWDLSTVNFSKQSNGLVVEPSSAPLLDSFPDANFVVLNVSVPDMADSVWSYTEWLHESVTDLGIVAHVSGFGESFSVYRDLTPRYVFPMDYNSQWTSSRMRSEDFSDQITYEYYDTVFYDVDAWGTLSYSGKTVPCLRLSYQQKTTTLTYLSGSLVSQSVSTEQGAEFFSSGFEFLAQVEKSTTAGFDTYSGNASDAFIGGATGVRENNPGMVPTGYELTQNYPNPFNPTTEIRFSLPRSSAVKLLIYNILGQEIKTLIDRPMDAGIYTADWDGTNNSGRSVASGIYFYRLTAGSFTETRKMVLVK
jgi:hypothetical protein